MSAFDWHGWHDLYESPGSSLQVRLATLQQVLGEVVSDAPPGRIQILDLCAGQGRVTVPVVGAHDRRHELRLTLVELDPRNCARSAQEVRSAGLTNVRVVVADAGRTRTYRDLPRADVVVISGVFRHLSRRHQRRLIQRLPEVCAADAVIVWAQGRPTRNVDAHELRAMFVASGFREERWVEMPWAGVIGVVAVEQMTAPPRRLRRRRWFRFRDFARNPAHRLRARLR